MSTNCTTISNETEGQLFDISTEIDEFIYGKEININEQLKLADFLIFMGNKLYSDAEIYGEASLTKKYNITVNSDIKKTEII